MRFQMHHVGIVVEDLAASASEYVRRYGYEIVSSPIEDPVQTAIVQFLRLPGAATYLELVTPRGEDSKLRGALKQKRHLNHVCYAVDDIDAVCAGLRDDGMFLLQAPVVASAFRPRRIAWLMGSDGIPVELVEAGEDQFPQ
jgi:methylmalonyl-CoA/ethylmalonyl-CoA epimerase